jgi:hypothetical protein
MSGSDCDSIDCMVYHYYKLMDLNISGIYLSMIIITIINEVWTVGASSGCLYGDDLVGHKSFFVDALD